MYSRQSPFVPPHLRLMLDTCPGFLNNFRVSFHNWGNVRLQLTRKQRQDSVALKLCSSFFFLVGSEDWIPQAEGLDSVFQTVLYSPPLSAPLLLRSSHPCGLGLQIKTAFKRPEPRSKPPVFPRNLPSFSRFFQASSRWGSNHKSWVWLLPQLEKFIWSMLLFACFSRHDSLTNVTLPHTL